MRGRRIRRTRVSEASYPMTKLSRYREAKGPEATAQPGSRGRVMLNRLGLTSKLALDQAEAH